MNLPIHGLKTEVKMEIRVQSIKFNADQKDEIIGVDVTMSLLPEHENKNVKVQVQVPGNDVVVERNARTFEDAIVDCIDVLKEKLVRVKEKKAN